MLNKIAGTLSTYLFSRKLISAEDIDMHTYGFELLISFLFSSSLILLSGIIFGCVVETLVFMGVFIFLRSFSGGYHALTYSFCTIITMSIYSSVMLLTNYTIVNTLAYYILFPCGALVLFVFAPIKNPNKPLTQQEEKKHKVISLILFALFWTIGFTTLKVDLLISNAVFYTMFADIILLFVKNRKNKIKIIEKGGCAND